MDSSFIEGQIATVETGPAYNLTPWSGRTSDRGPQCSATGDFCFFCAFTEPDDPDSDGAALWTVVRSLVERRKELPAVVSAVKDIYDSHLRDSTVFVSEGVEQRRPVWTRDAISRHLLFSSEFPQLFDTSVEHIFRALIVQQNNSVLDRDTGSVIPEARRDLIDTIDAYARYRKTCASIYSGKSQKSIKSS